ncbi:tyrosine-type recombinase/integrase [Nocardia araoensis]|uniref:tyrosine-type recombinase/integrase n=1 Tax=Nocardia araoensis TaxID=228600 RepID=UPI001C3F1CDD|nr:site-specific integrase [Nocardia araoensis]
MPGCFWSVWESTRKELLRTTTPASRTPTFAEYVPRVAEAVSAGARRTYLPYWRQLSRRWPDRPIDQPTHLELQELVEQTRRTAVLRRNNRGGRSAAEHMVCAIRCLYRYASNDGHISASTNPSAHLEKPRRQPSTRRALSTGQLEQINNVAATTGDDPELDTLLLRLHLETACRTGSALKLRPEDLDPEQYVIRLSGKGGTLHWQPVSPTLMTRLIDHGERSPDPGLQLLRYRHGRPITRRRYDHLWNRIGRHLSWVANQQITTHWLRYTTLTWVERNFGYATARAFAAHAGPTGQDGATFTYVRASVEEVATALAALTDEAHPLAPPHEISTPIADTRKRTGTEAL